MRKADFIFFFLRYLPLCGVQESLLHVLCGFLVVVSDRFIIKERGYMGDRRRGSERYIEIHYLISKTMKLLS